MDEEDTKLCANCKREIPAVNFTIHSVHCARNIRPCPVCKEPVPVAQLTEHHDSLHKEVPCKMCGDSVCGTDLEDHVRDSCAQTIKPCRYCELELPRSALPAHEAYCGARSEQCPDCREYVMAKYRQLHLDSNHGFLRLDEDPVPAPKPKPTNGVSSSTGVLRHAISEIRRLEAEERRAAGSSGAGYNGAAPNTRVPKRNNDQPQINTNVQPVEKVNKELASRGAVKKRQAPPPPDERRDSAYWSAARRRDLEEQQRRQQSERNLAQGLPPVLSAAAKLDKLRKMDALHNRESDTQDYKNCLQGRVWMPMAMDVDVGQLLGCGRRGGDGGGGSGSGGGGGSGGDLRNLQPMSPAQFMNRFQELQLGTNGRGGGSGSENGRGGGSGSGSGSGGGGDRFDEIKSSLRELRRGLNEVTAPYNAAPSASNNAHIDSNRLCPPSPPGEELLPCEFCSEPVPVDDLVLHQTGCRPDLARLQPRRPAPAPRAPVIPCEFCARPLPIFLLSDHQERCGREANILHPD